MSWRIFRRLLRQFEAGYDYLGVAERAIYYVPWVYPGDQLLSVHDNLRTLSIKSIVAFLKRLLARLIGVPYYITVYYPVAAPPPEVKLRHSLIDPYQAFAYVQGELYKVEPLAGIDLIVLVDDALTSDWSHHDLGVFAETSAQHACTEHGIGYCVWEEQRYSEAVPTVKYGYAHAGRVVDGGWGWVGAAAAWRAEWIEDPTKPVRLASFRMEFLSGEVVLLDGSRVVASISAGVPTVRGATGTVDVCTVDPYRWHSLVILGLLNSTAFVGVGIGCLDEAGALIGFVYSFADNVVLTTGAYYDVTLEAGTRPAAAYSRARFIVDWVAYGFDPLALHRLGAA